jgi:hypothetical protein
MPATVIAGLPIFVVTRFCPVHPQIQSDFDCFNLCRKYAHVLLLVSRTAPKPHLYCWHDKMAKAEYPDTTSY